MPFGLGHVVGNTFVVPKLGLNFLEPWRRILPGGDIGLAVCILFQLAILILPIPTVLLDVSIAFSFAVSILILLISVSIKRPLDFSSFPTLLLLTTILRLSLNVATARLILSRGHEGSSAAGQVVAAFGGFLMGGDVFVGSALFAMLLIVNFIVITKGSSRIAEVSARFYLDSMPGRQMAIDADLSSGVIDEPTAKMRRAELSEESTFFGAMDGASKFVRGDAICALVITLINVFGGLGIGITRSRMSIWDAISTFTTLTVGDGLVSQIPALLISTAAGIVVSKGAAEGAVQRRLLGQLGASSSPIFVVSTACGVLALLPGLPTIPFLVVAALSAALAWRRSNAKTVEHADATVALPKAESDPPLASTMDTLRVELGYGLLEIAGNSSHQLPDQIRRLRRALATELGFVLPSVRIQDNVDLDPFAYVIALKEITAGKGELRPGLLLAISHVDSTASLPGEKTFEPTFGLPAYWISPAMADQARAANWTVVDAATVLTTHIAEVVKENVPEFVTYSETQKLLAGLSQEHQKLVADLIPSAITTGGLQRVLQSLLAERISIRDIPTILEAVQEACAGQSKSVSSIVAHVRVRLARQISDSLTDERGYIATLPLSKEWEENLTSSLIGTVDDRQLALSPEKLRDFLDRLRNGVESAGKSGEKPVILTSLQLRPHVYAITDRMRLNVPVLAQQELHRRTHVKVVGVI